jgi:hypothetical protein
MIDKVGIIDRICIIDTIEKIAILIILIINILKKLYV